MDGFRHDLRGAFRAFTRRPGFSALAVLTLAVGIGLNAVAFTAVNAMFLKGHSGAHLRDAGWIFRTTRGDSTVALTIADLDALTRNARSFAVVAAEGRMPLALYRQGQTDQVWALLVTPDYFSVIDEQPADGRAFGAGAVDDSRSVLVSERFWTDRFGDAPLSGQTLTLNGVDFGVIGIVRDDHQGPGGLFTPDLWAPLAARHAMRLPASLDDPKEGWLLGLGRLAPGVEPAAARGELQALFEDRAATEPGKGGTFVAFSDRHPEARGLWWIGVLAMSAVSLVLLIACFNVAGLLLARSLERTREMAVRRALGAGGIRLVRQLLTENIVLAIAAGIAAVIVAFWSGSLLGSFALPAPIPQRLDLRPDGMLVLYIAAMVAIAGVLPALAPALQALRVDVVHALKGESAGGGKPSKARGYFVALQVAGSTLFLAIALLFGQSFASTISTDTGFEKENALVMQVEPSLQGLTIAETRTVVDAFIDRLAATPGVVNVGAGDRMSFYVGYPNVEHLARAGDSCTGDDCTAAKRYKVDPDYFAALGIPLVAGRALSADDVRQGRGAVVSAQLASTLFPNASAIGQTVRLTGSNETIEIVGVTADIKHHMMHEAPVSALYLPLEDEDYRGALTIIARTSVPPAAITSAAREQWRTLDARLPLPVMQTMTERLRLPLWPVRTGAGFFGVCGALAVLLATVGLFGAIAYAAAQRTREFGIRAAIGASSSMLGRLVMRDALKLAAPGVAIGLAAAWMLSRATGSRLPGVDTGDPATYAMVAGLQLAVAIAACLLPARRAARVDPMLCLRAN